MNRPNPKDSLIPAKTGRVRFAARKHLASFRRLFNAAEQNSCAAIGALIVETLDADSIAAIKQAEEAKILSLHHSLDSVFTTDPEAGMRDAAKILVNPCSTKIQREHAAVRIIKNSHPYDQYVREKHAQRSAANLALGASTYSRSILLYEDYDDRRIVPNALVLWREKIRMLSEKENGGDPLRALYHVKGTMPEAETLSDKAFYRTCVSLWGDIVFRVAEKDPVLAFALAARECDAEKALGIQSEFQTYAELTRDMISKRGYSGPISPAASR